MKRFATTSDGRILFAAFTGKSHKPWYKVFIGLSLETIEPLRERLENGSYRHVGGRSIEQITARAAKFFKVIPD